MNCLLITWVIAATLVAAAGSPGKDIAGPRDELAALAPQQKGITLTETITRIVAQSTDLTKAQADLRDAKVQATGALLGFVPRIDVSLGYTRFSEVTLPPFVVNGVATDNPFPQLLNHYALQTGIALPISEYFTRIYHEYRQAQIRKTATQQQLFAYREHVALAAIQSYLRVVRARAALRVAREAEKTLAAQLADTKQRVQAGAAIPLDAMQVTAQLANARVQFGRASGAYDVARMQLSRMLGSDVPNQGAHPSDDLRIKQMPQTPNRATLLAEAMANRHELLGMQHLMTIREHAISKEFGAQFPRLFLSASLFHANPNNRIFPPEQKFDTTWQMGAGIAWSPNDFIDANSRWRTAKEEYIKTRADLRALQDKIAIEVENAISAMGVAGSALNAANDGLRSALEDFTARKELLAAGGATTTEVLNSETRLRRARLQLIDAHLDIHLALALVAHARGNLYERYVHTGVQR